MQNYPFEVMGREEYHPRRKRLSCPLRKPSTFHSFSTIQRPTVAPVFRHGQPLHVAQPDVLCLKGISGLSNLQISHVHRVVETVCCSEMLCPLTRLHGVTTQKTIIWTVTIVKTSKLITELIYDSLVSKVMGHGPSSGFTPSRSPRVFFFTTVPRLDVRTHQTSFPLVWGSFPMSKD
jgi:hypothetical protein